MLRHLISSVPTSRINTLADTKNEILVSQKETTQAINQLNMEYNELSRDINKRNKLAKENAKVKEKIKDLKEQELE
jgi:seryl-tRNA synthetase